MTDDQHRHDDEALVTPENRPPTPVARANGKQILRATWALLREDKELIALPFVGSVFSVMAAIVFFVPGYGLGWLAEGEHDGRVAYYAGVVLAGVGATIVGVYFQTALVIGANERADGGDPTIGSCLRGAWKHRWQVLGWALVASTIGALLRAVQQRLGFVGFIANLVGGLAWTIATYVVVPVLVSEAVGPVEAVKRSTQILKDTWGTSLRTAARGSIWIFGLVLAPTIVVMAGLVLVFADGNGAVITGAVLLAVGLVLLVAVTTLLGAVGGYARALIYRYAVGLPTPGIDDEVLAGAFRPKGAH